MDDVASSIDPADPEDETIWPEPNDELREYVRNHLRETRRPETLKGRSRSKPDKDQEWEGIWPFDVTPPKGEARRRIHCPLCRHEEKYFKGAVYWFDDGRLRLFGWKCAEEHFGTAVTRQKRQAFEQRMIRERFIERLLEIGPKIQAAKANVASFNASDAAIAVVRFRGELDAKMHELYIRLLVAITAHNGALTVVEQESAKYRELTGRDATRSHFDRQIGMMYGYRGIDTGSQPRLLCDDSWEEMAAALRILEKAPLEELRVKDMGDVIRRIGSAIEKARQARDLVNQVMRFCQQDNIFAIVSWANDERREYLTGRYDVMPRGFRWAPDDRDDVVVQLPAGLRVPALAAVEDLAVAIQGRD